MLEERARRTAIDPPNSGDVSETKLLASSERVVETVGRLGMEDDRRPTSALVLEEGQATTAELPVS